jgi:hypothetical protein
MLNNEILAGNPQMINHLRDKGVEGRIKLKWMLRYRTVGTGSKLNRLRIV